MYNWDAMLSCVVMIDDYNNGLRIPRWIDEDAEHGNGDLCFVKYDINNGMKVGERCVNKSSDRVREVTRYDSGDDLAIFAIGDIVGDDVMEGVFKYYQMFVAYPS